MGVHTLPSTISVEFLFHSFCQSVLVYVMVYTLYLIHLVSDHAGAGSTPCQANCLCTLVAITMWYTPRMLYKHCSMFTNTAPGRLFHASGKPDHDDHPFNF